MRWCKSINYEDDDVAQLIWPYAFMLIGCSVCASKVHYRVPPADGGPTKEHDMAFVSMYVVHDMCYRGLLPWVETYIRSAGDSMSYSTLERNENHVQPRHPTLHMIVKRVYKLETSFFSPIT